MTGIINREEMFLKELLKHKLDSNRKGTRGQLLIEYFFWIFESMTTSKKEQSSKDLVLITSELLNR